MENVKDILVIVEKQTYIVGDKITAGKKADRQGNNIVIAVVETEGQKAKAYKQANNNYPFLLYLKRWKDKLYRIIQMNRKGKDKPCEE